jgi:hypothetical protein
MKAVALAALMLVVGFSAWGVVADLYHTPITDFKILVTQGVVVEKSVMLQGQRSAVPAIKIVQAMNAEGRMMNSLQNRTLRVVGPLANDVLALRGQDVVVRGIVRDNRFLEVTWFEVKKEASHNIHAPTPVW